ncbi:MAG: hypothetical protein KF810_03355 [Rhizobiaceae bacterium]|nr:hypothetical protein [Rhizobiaceae bacterium]
MLLIGFAAAALSLVVASAHAQDRVWIGDTYEEGASLIYGTPDTGDIALSFSCARGSGKVAFSYIFEPINPTEGARVEVTLEAGDIIMPVQTTGTRLEMDDIFVLEGQIPFDAQLVDLLTSQGALEVFVEDGSEEIPLEGARQAGRKLFETCPLSR